MPTPFEDAAAACGRGDHATALQLFRPVAEEGDAAARMTPAQVAAAEERVRTWPPA